MQAPAVLPREHCRLVGASCRAGDPLFQSTSVRLFREHATLTRWARHECERIGQPAGAVILHFVLVILRVYSSFDPRLRPARRRHVLAARETVRQYAPSLFPFDQGLADRLRLRRDVPQPQLLAEILDSLYPAPSSPTTRCTCRHPRPVTASWSCSSASTP